MECTICDKLPSPADYNCLRAAVGWRTFSEAAVKRFLPNSLYSVCSYAGDRLVAMARVVGDGGLVFYIQDVIVLPARQEQGIGRALMERVMAWIMVQAQPGAVIGLMAAVGREGFYERYGFIRRPNEQQGCGMTYRWE
ncbi:MAG: GNAT family N-acetyltransferase [Chloroflexi bacterium]|nr:GNAT family N-acetyltransferase [Chloroflexota bacterium]